jgi:hypothetical protein
LGLSSEPVYWSEQKVDGVDTLIVQWQNSPHYPAIGDVTFQMQVFATGSTLARFVYSDVEFGDPLLDFGASATIGYQVNEREAYEFNFGAADISSNFLPTRPVANGDVVDLILLPDIDDYTVDLNAFRGKAIDIGLAGTSGQDFRSAQLQLLDSTGKVVAEATREPLGALSDNYSLAIAGWRVPNAGDSSYTLRVSSNMVGEYGLVVTGTAMLEIQPGPGRSAAKPRREGRGPGLSGRLRRRGPLPMVAACPSLCGDHPDAAACRRRCEPAQRPPAGNPRACRRRHVDQHHL